MMLCRPTFTAQLRAQGQRCVSLPVRSSWHGAAVQHRSTSMATTTEVPVDSEQRGTPKRQLLEHLELELTSSPELHQHLRDQDPSEQPQWDSLHALISDALGRHRAPRRRVIAAQRAFLWLSDRLCAVQVRVMMKSTSQQSERPFLFLDCRPPGDIQHPHPETGVTITSAAWYEQKGIVLEHPQLPCVGLARRKKEMELEEEQAAAQGRPVCAWLHYPLEMCSVVLDKSTARVKVKGLSAPKPTSSVDAIGSEAAVPADLAELFNAALQAATDDDSCWRPHSQQKRRRLRFSRPTGLSRRMRLPAHGSAAAAAAPRSAGQSRVWRGDRSSPGTAEQQLQTDFSRFVKLLVPTEAESSCKRSVLNALCSIRNELPQDIRRRCTIARIVIAGSVAKSTDLAGTADLDVVVFLELAAHGGASFEQCRLEVLSLLEEKLCTPAAASASPDATVGWRLLPCVTNFFARFYHDQFKLQLDVQVAQSFSANHIQQRDALLKPLLLAAASSSTADGSSTSGAAAPLLASSRQRVTDLAEAARDVVKGTESLFGERYGIKGYGRLLTDVVRALKAWSRYGLPDALAATAPPLPPSHAHGADVLAALEAQLTWGIGGTVIAGGDGDGDGGGGGGGGGGARAVIHPPAYIWEIVVLSQMHEAAEEGRHYRQDQALDLFADVLRSAAARLRTSAPVGDGDGAGDSSSRSKPPYIVPVLYTRDQALAPAIMQLWGRGRLFEPAIINPVDPTYNSTLFSNFRQWDDLAQAAGELAAALEVARKGTARRPGGGPDGWNLPWVQLCSSVPTLRKAWRTACAMRALVDTSC